MRRLCNTQVEQLSLAHSQSAHMLIEEIIERQRQLLIGC
jgi:hypothetical protein